MEEKFPADVPSLSVLGELTKDSLIVDDCTVSFKKIYESLNFPWDFSPLTDKYSGCVDGRQIGIYRPATKSIYLYDHTLSSQTHISLPYDTMDAFFHISLNDHIIVLIVGQHDNEIYTKCNVYFHERLISSIPIECTDRVIDAYFWDTGCVFLTERNSIWYVPKFQSAFKFITLPPENPISKLKAIPETCSDVNVPVIFAHGEAAIIYIIDGGKTGNVPRITGIPTMDQVLYFDFNADYTEIALLYINNTLMICPSNLQGISFTYEIEDFPDMPLEMKWMDEFIIISSCSVIALCPKNSSVEMFFLESQSPAIFSNKHHCLVYTKDVIYRIASTTENVLGVVEDHTSPANRLLNALHDKKANIVHQLLDECVLQDAIQSCLKCASFAFTNTVIQSLFIMAAAFGNTFLSENYNDPSKKPLSYDITDTVKNLRVMNYANQNLDLFMCYDEVANLVYYPIIPLKFCLRNMHSNAFEMCKFLSVDRDQIATDWCCFIMEQFPNDDDAYTLISRRYDDYFNAIDVAIQAEKMNRKDLSKMILKLETFPIKIVNFYLSTKNYEGAFDAALRSTDTICLLRVIDAIIKNGDNDSLYTYVGKNLDAFYFIHNLFTNSLKYIPALPEPEPEPVKGKKIKRQPPDIRKSIEESENIQKLRTILKNVPLTAENYEVKLLQISQQLGKTYNLEVLKTEKSSLKQNRKLNPLIDSEYVMLQNLKRMNKALETKADSVGKPSSEKGYIPFNKAIEKLALEGNFKEAIELVKSTKSSVFLKNFFTRRAQVLIIRSIVLNKRTEMYRTLSTEFPELRAFTTSIILLNDGPEAADRFVNYITDAKEKAQLQSYLSQRPTENPLHIRFNGKEIFKNVLFDR